MYLEMQIFAFRDRLRISLKTSQGILFKIPDFFPVYSTFYTDFVHINDCQCKWIYNMHWKYNLFIKNCELTTFWFLCARLCAPWHNVRFYRYKYCNYGFVNRPFKDALDDLLLQIWCRHVHVLPIFGKEWGSWSK